MKTHLRKLQSGDVAQGVAEYAIMFGIVLALVLGIAQFTGLRAGTLFEHVASALK